MRNPTPTSLPPANSLQSGQMYIGLCNLANGEGNRRWTRAQTFLVMHTPALAAILPYLLEMFGTKPEGTPPVGAIHFPLIVIASFLGMALSLVWLMAAQRSDRWLRFWCESIRDLEIHPSARAQVAVFSSPEFTEPEHDGVSFHRLATALPLLFFFAWCTILIVAIVVRV